MNISSNNKNSFRFFNYIENIIVNCDIPLYYYDYPLNKIIEINEKNY